jgi:hypothetical protein
MEAAKGFRRLKAYKHLPILELHLPSGLTRIPMMDALGTSSCSNSSRFPSNMPANTVTPVTFPPVA